MLPRFILILIFFIGFCYLEPGLDRVLDVEPVRYEIPEPQPYVYKCHTDMECQEEEEACLKSGECVYQR